MKYSFKIESLENGLEELIFDDLDTAFDYYSRCLNHELNITIIGLSKIYEVKER